LTLVLPQILNLPDKLLPLVERFNEFKYFLAEGGRGGGKSQGIARLFLYLCEKYKLRIVCGREIQKSIEESVYTIFRDLIVENQLDFEVLATRITHRKTGSTINFKGFREQGSINIKGLEGVDILWIDEAQSITKYTLDIIIPTIRKEKAKVFFSMNRHLKNDPVFKEFSTRDDCLNLHINYYDNPYCSQALKHEARLCLEKSPEDYQHIWEGEPLEQADNFLFVEQELEDCDETDFLGCGSHEMVMGVDVARYGNDKCVAHILQKRGPLKWETKHIERWGKKNLMESTGRIVDLMTRFKLDAVAIDADGMVGVCDRLMELKYNINEFHGGFSGVDHVEKPESFANVKSEWFFKLKDCVTQGYMGSVPRETLNSMLTVMYTHRSNGQKIIVSKEQMRSQGFKSPDEADAMMMAFYATKFLGRKIEQNEDFKTPGIIGSRQNNNLFTIAGYR
jgi:phage terminase large subunit